MISRRVHALLVSLPAVALATGATVLGGLLVQSIRAGDDMARTVLIGLFAWPTAVAAVSFLARAVRTARDSGRPDPVRTLGIAPVGGAWRIPVRRRHPLSTACLAVAGCGGLMALLAALGVLASPAWWHVAVSVAGSLLVGAGALAVLSVLDRDGRASMVLDPRERLLILPRTRSRGQVVRIALDRVRAVTTEVHGPLGLMQRVRIDFDDELLGQGVTQTMLDGVDPGRAMDLVAWVRGFVASAAAASPARPAVVAPAPAAAAAAAPAPAASAASAPIAAAGTSMPPGAAPGRPMAAGGAGAMPARPAAPLMRRARRGSWFFSIVGRTNMPTALAGLGLACVLLFVGFGLRMHPRQSAASAAAAGVSPGTRAGSTWIGSLGTDVHGTTVQASDLDADWIWTMDVAPSSGVSDEQIRVLGPLRQRFGEAVTFRVVLVSGDRGGELPTARLATWYAGRAGLPAAMMLIRPEPGVPVPRHRMMRADGRIVFESSGFMSAGSIGTQISLHQAAARVEQHP